MTWPIGLRRVALVTFPAALPLWVALLAARGLLRIGDDAAAVLRRVWNAPPRRRSPGRYGRYYRR